MARFSHSSEAMDYAWRIIAANRERIGQRLQEGELFHLLARAFDAGAGDLADRLVDPATLVETPPDEELELVRNPHFPGACWALVADDWGGDRNCAIRNRGSGRHTCHRHAYLEDAAAHLASLIEPPATS